MRTADCERADCKTQAPAISCGHLDSFLLGAQRAPSKKKLRSIPRMFVLRRGFPLRYETCYMTLTVSIKT